MLADICLHAERQLTPGVSYFVQEVNGGKSYAKIGHVALNLAQYAGRGKTERRFLLQAEKKSSRQDNSLILVSAVRAVLVLCSCSVYLNPLLPNTQVAVSMRLIEGDPVYKA